MKKLLFPLFVILFSQNLNAQATRKVIVEDFTGLWCGWCPLGKTVSEHLDSVFEESVINIGMHDFDSLQCDYSVSIDSINYYGFPGFLVDRTTYKNNLFQAAFVSDIWGSDLDSAVYARLAVPSPVDVLISRTYNSSSRLLTATVTASFLGNASGNMRINCVLIEDSIQTDNAQNNYMDSDPSFIPWYSTGNPIYAYTQRHTARKNLSANAWGDQSIIPVSVLSGSSYSKTYTYTIPNAWNVNQMKIVAFISEWGAGTSSNYIDVDTSQISILNANAVSITSPVGISENSISNNILGNCYPNPFTNTITFPLKLKKENLVSVKIYNTLGIEIKSILNSSLLAGNHTLKWDGTDLNGNSMPNGIYICSVCTDEGTISRHIVLNR